MLRVAISLLFLTTSISVAAQPSKPKNVIFILADDIGYGDLGSCGATLVKTPNLDKLASQGTRFTDAHSPAAVCTPTRYAFITGQYAFRHKPGASILSGVAPLSIPAERDTVAKLMKRAGYHTGVVGKWHLGLGDKPTDYNSEIKPGAKEVGFDYSFLIPATGDRVPCVYVENGKVVGYDPADPIEVNYQTKIGDEPTGKENPELLFNQKPSLGHNNTIVNGISRIGWMSGGKAARWKDEDMADTITSKAINYIKSHSNEPFFLYFSTHDVHVPRFPHPRFRGTSGHGLRGDCIQEFDWSIGEIMNTLTDLKLADDTLLIVTSDNGGVMDDGYIDGTGDDKSGHKCNGPLRGYKGGLFEGGHRLPFIARWPGKVQQGKVSDALITHTDMFATLATLTGQKLAEGAAPDSKDILPALLGEKTEKPCREVLIHQGGYIGGLAIRSGDWKLIPGARSTERNPSAPGPQLFHLSEDLGETKNVAKDHPEIVKRLTDLLDQQVAASQTR